MDGITLLIVAAVVVGLFLLVTFNTLVGRRNKVRNAFGTVDVLLKKRYDLIPNLVATVQGYMQHERTVLQQITDLRSRAMGGPLPPEQLFRVNAQLGQLLGGVRAAIENYPQLKASQNALQLQAALNEVEEQISAGRRAYNAAVTDLNNALEMFPSNLVGSLFGFQKAVFFEAGEAERGAVPVQLGGAP
ncbi:MAG TPA: LemA family protein [Kiritimatiellia bacterium]|nr:LemA family protein [Kiritimatiellia bacterium]HRZ11289.1 LemA family protein [Kiritimatiellia bacterium]HSA19772.1 LemA family protein [Kiritimatiellia bacterium]